MHDVVGPGPTDPSGGTPCFAKVDQSGGSINQNIGDAGANADTETSLDMDMISAACPDCSILLVQIKALTDADILAGVKIAAVALGAFGHEHQHRRPRRAKSDPTGPQ